MNIAILLPFKENYSSKLAGAVSLFINDINNKSKFKTTTTIYGSTDEKKFLSKKNYKFLVSITHEKNYAIGLVVVEKLN